MLPAACAVGDKAAHGFSGYAGNNLFGSLRSTVLPHEDAAEFSDLLAALVEEHQPAGATEMPLVEDLAEVRMAVIRKPPDGPVQL